MAKADIFRAIENQRAGINRSEKQMLRDLAKMWVPTYRYLEKQVNDLTAAIQAQQDRGESVWIGYVYSLDRYQQMMEQARRQIDQYNRAAMGLISGEEADAVKLGGSNANELIHIAAADDPDWVQVDTRSTRIMAGMLSEESPLSDLLNKSWPETKSGIEQALSVGIATGQGSDWIARQMMQAADIPYKRALTIARTEVNRAYREANLETMRESSVVRGYRRMCYKPTACFACLMLDGEYYDKKEDFSDHPNGKCTIAPVTKHFDPINSPEWETGPEWFEKQDPETQRKLMGAGRYELWQNQGVNPRDMVYVKENKVWGGSPSIRTLDELKNGISLRPVMPSNRSMANGLRKPAYYVLSDSEIDDLKKDIRAIGADESVFRFNNGRRTGYVDSTDTINIRGDVLPDQYSIKARDKMSSRAVLAHEYYGHRANRGTILPAGSWNDEFRASYMAAKNAPGLSDEDRYYLIQDAIDRALEHGAKIRYNKFMKEVLYGEFQE